MSGHAFDLRPGQATARQGRPDSHFASPRWRLRFALHDLALQLGAGRDHLDASADPYDIVGTCGGHAFQLGMPAHLLDALLSRAPEPMTAASLSAEDGALMLEHILTEPLARLEAVLKASITFLHIARRTSPPAMDAIPLSLEAQGQRFALDLSLDHLALRDQLEAEIARLDIDGPGAVPGMAVAVGPVYLAAEDIPGLAAGDHLLLDGATAAALRGAVFLDETLYWPVELSGGGLTVLGALKGVPNDLRIAPVFLHVGTTAEASTMDRGVRLGLRTPEDNCLALRIGNRTIGIGNLTERPEGIAIHVSATGES